MGLSVIDPVSPAIERTKQILFRPFILGKWLRLGFCAFVMGLGSGGGGGGGGGGGSNDAKIVDANPEPFIPWVRDELPVILLIAAIAISVIILIVLLVIWLSSRGYFMFLDGVVRNRGAVVEPWREFRREGNSLMWFRMWLGFVALITFLVFVGFFVVLALPDIMANRFETRAVMAMVFSICTLVPYCVILGATVMMLGDFVVPIMYMRRIGVLEAWQVWFREMLSGNLGTFVLYFLFKIVILMSVTALTLLALCGTCCLILIPYVGTVILLPLSVFTRCYSLCFIEQFGPNWVLYPPLEQSEQGLDTI